MPDGLPIINKDSLFHLSKPFLRHCNQVRVTGHGLSSLIVKFLIFIFFSGLGIVHDITHFLKQHIFSICDFTCNQLDHPHYLSTSFHFLFWLLSKVLSQNFQFFFPEISILHFLAIIFGYSTFWLTLHVPPSTNIVIQVQLSWRLDGVIDEMW